MRPLILALIITLTPSCSVTLVYAPKTVCNHGNDNKTEITGSDLKGATATQSAQGELKIPFTP